MHKRLHSTPRRRRGGALVTSLIIVSLLLTVVSAAITVQIQNGKEAHSVGLRTRARYASENGVNEALITIADALRNGQPVPAGIGTEDNPAEVPGARYWVTITDNGDDTYLVQSQGRAGTAGRGTQAMIQVTRSIYEHAVFAGNSGGSSSYRLRLGGSGLQADDIQGDIYSGGDLQITGNASVSGEISAGGRIIGATGAEGVSMTLPDISAMNYETTADVMVADEFAGGSASYSSNSLGGSAWQLPEANPAHIFRKNPSDRTTETAATAKDDYFLEDPYLASSAFTTTAGSTSGYSVSLSGGSPGQLTYYIDGNLWIHNYRAMGFRFESQGASGTQVTLVVKGNIYFSDDLELANDTLDGLALVAIKDELEPDSGNIYLGDPRFGTLDRVESFLYAENNFHDNNISAAGSKKVTLVGNMTAGNQVAIQRDHVDSGGTSQHSKLTVEFDDRVANGVLDLPNLPQPVMGFEGLDVLFWSGIALD